ncbi:MAG: class I SAM-dependent methyltransferase [Sphingomonas sp.]|nr:class I SAM-dependent methyltransferase [Sphingomonas sp.]
MSSEAWSDFWKSDQAEAGCGALASRWDTIQAAQKVVWQDFARSLGKSARVLDLATGNGIVMGWLISARRDLKPVGVDLAPRLPAPPKGCRSMPGVAMEALPFQDESYDAAVSQFGVEYGDLPRVLSQLARVLKVGGKAGLITHRGAGPIMLHNRIRRDGLRWVLDDKDVIGKARAGLALRRVGVAVPPIVAACPADARAQFGHGSAAWELSEAVVQTLTLGRGESDSNLLETLKTLETKARNEIARIDSLERACEAVADADRLKDLFARNGLRLDNHQRLHHTPGSHAFADAWLLHKLAPGGR